MKTTVAAVVALWLSAPVGIQGRSAAHVESHDTSKDPSLWGP